MDRYRGSSPRVRGTAVSSLHNMQRQRFIPACAGNRNRIKLEADGISVHPRVCGEQSFERALITSDGGSSPRVRGTGSRSHNWAYGRRFIPACAGNRAYSRMATPKVTVHPRVCGEQTPAAQGGSPKGGSSPRVRGTARPGSTHARARRFIPACAGNRAVSNVFKNVDPVHPRVCGEQNEQSVTNRVSSGSSPRVRGTAAFHRSIAISPRFIPACAGNSFS